MQRWGGGKALWVEGQEEHLNRARVSSPGEWGFTGLGHIFHRELNEIVKSDVLSMVVIDSTRMSASTSSMWLTQEYTEVWRAQFSPRLTNELRPQAKEHPGTESSHTLE